MSMPPTPSPPDAIPIAQVAPAIEYGRFAEFNPRNLAAARLLLVLAILSGLCVGVCFLTIASHKSTAATIHALTFLFTICFGVASARKISPAPKQALRATLDSVAALGLLGIGIAPFLALSNPDSADRALTCALAVCYLFLAATTYRHILLYRIIASWLTSSRHASLARRLRRLSYWKAIFEALWLALCSTTLFMLSRSEEHTLDEKYLFNFALASLAGCAIYGIVWIIMIIYHVQLAAALKRHTA